MKNNKEFSIAAVILNYNSFQDTIKLVNELQLQTINEKLKIVVVDNCSPNSSYQELKKLEISYKNVTVLETEENLGYAKGNNFGLKYLEKEINPEFVVILNNDVFFSKNVLKNLVKKYKTLENPGVVAPIQLDIKEQKVLPYRMNSFIDDFASLFLIFRIFHRRKAIKLQDNTGLNAMKVEIIPGSFMFVSYQRFKQMGYFYNNTFLFCEERFIASTAKRLKYTNYIILDETYIHAHSKTINTTFNKVRQFRLMYDSWLEYTKVFRSHGKLKTLILRPFMKLSLLEMSVVYKVNDAIRGKFNLSKAPSNN